MTREYPDRPIVGVGAVVFSGNKVLLVRRGREPAKGQWSIPGGKVEIGETLTQAVIREVAEETGLKVKVEQLIKTLERIFHDKEGRVQYHYVLCDFLCKVVDGDLAPSSDAADVRFISIDALQAYKVAPITRQVIHEAHTPGVAPIYNIKEE